MAKRYRITAVQQPAGHLLLDRDTLPEAREARLSLCLRLIDSLRVQVHADQAGESPGALWVEHAKESFVAGWLK